MLGINPPLIDAVMETDPPSVKSGVSGKEVKNAKLLAPAPVEPNVSPSIFPDDESTEKLVRLIQLVDPGAPT